MQNKIILHVGLHKTGTTTLQKYLMSYNQEKYFYPNINNIENHGILLSYLLYPINEIPEFIIKRAIDNKWPNRFLMIKELKNQFEISKHKVPIISSENFTNENISLKQLQTIKQFFLRQGFKTFKILFYYRSYASHLNSIFQEKIKSGIKIIKDGMFDKQVFNINYKLRLENIYKVFGEHEIIPVYIKDKNFDTVINFSKIIGFDINSYDGSKKNESLDTLSTKIILVYNHIIEKTKKRLDLAQDLKKFSKNKFTLPNEIISHYVDTDDLFWANKIFANGLIHQKKQDIGNNINSTIKNFFNFSKDEIESFNEILLSKSLLPHRKKALEEVFNYINTNNFFFKKI